MKLTQEEIKKVVFIQANIRGFLVRQEIRRQLFEIYEYEKEQLEYLQGQQYSQGDYSSQQYRFDYDQQDDESERQSIRQSQKEEFKKNGQKEQNFRKKDINLKNNDDSDENIEFHRSSNSSSIEIEKKVQEKYLQQQMYLKEKQQAHEYQLHQLDQNKQKSSINQHNDAQKLNNGVCLASGKNEAEFLKFPQLHPIFSNSQMKQLVSKRESQDEVILEENINQKKEKLKNIAQQLKKEEDDTDNFSSDNFKVKLYSQSANIARNFDDNEDEEEEDSSIQEKQLQENIGINKQKQSEQLRQALMQQQQYKENHSHQDYLNQKSVNISVEITESNLLTEKRLNLLPISNHNNQNNKQNNSGKQSNNIYQNNNQTKNLQTSNKINQNRFYQEEDQYYINQQINLYSNLQKDHQQGVYAQKGAGQIQVDSKKQNLIQVIDQFSPQSESSSSNNHKGTHFAKISNIEYRSYPGDNFLFEDSQNYEAYQRHGADFHHHQHHPQQASFSEPQENNELIINKSVFIKNMGVIKQMQEEQKQHNQNTINHEKNMKKIRKMIHQNQILNSKNHKRYLQLSGYSLESYCGSSKYEERESIPLSQAQMDENILETTQQQQHNNGQIFDTRQVSDDISMMSSRVPESSKLDSKNKLGEKNKKRTPINNSSIRSAGSVNTNTLMGSINKKPIMFDFDIYIIAATKIQKVFKGYLSRKFIVKYRTVKQATLIIEAQYLKFKQFLVKKMKDCTNQIECSSYNIIKLVQDFEKGEKFLKSQFRKKNFDQKIKVNRDKLCKVFIQFINNHPENKLEDGKKLTADQENLSLQKEILKLKSFIIKQQRDYKEDLESMQKKYDELRNLHKETIKKYINGIQNLSQKRKGSNFDVTFSNLQDSQQQSSYSSGLKNKQQKIEENNTQKLLKYYKESDKEISDKLKPQNLRIQQNNYQQMPSKQEQYEASYGKRCGSSADCKRTNKSPDRAYIQKQFESLKNEAERDLEDFESQIKKIKYQYGTQKSTSPSNKQRKQEESRNNQHNKGNGKNSDHSYDKDKKKMKSQQSQKQTNMYNYNDCSNNSNKQNNSIHHQYMSDEFINYSKFSNNTSSKQ